MLRDSIAKFFKVDSLISNLTGYVETKIELLKLEVKEDLTRELAKGLVYLLVAFVFALFIVLISIAVALKIGASLGWFTGFAIVAGVYLMGSVALILSRETLGKKFEKRLREVLKKKK
ncbi:MAG: phage holin family protein [Bacteroidota bacterium]